jgi:D-amino-acid oxidase
MSTSQPPIVVVGAGVTGLTTALVLAREGVPVRVVARARSPHTTSDVAAAVWYPFRVGPAERAIAWSRRTLEVFRTLLAIPEAGVTWMPGIDLQPGGDAAEPWWKAAVPSFRRARHDEIPPGFGDGFVLEAPVVRMPVYLKWLEGRLASRGVFVEAHEVDDLDLAFPEAAVVVNATGLGARDLLGDREVRPVRGQIVRVAAGGARRFVQADHGPCELAYVIPRPDCVVLGGTQDEDAWDTTVDPEVARAIVARCEALEPGLRGAPVLSHAVGLRPWRREVRLEAETRGGRTVVHNYGHGGAGVTMSWGCAEEAARLALSVVR